MKNKKIFRGFSICRTSLRVHNKWMKLITPIFNRWHFSERYPMCFSLTKNIIRSALMCWVAMILFQLLKTGLIKNRTSFLFYFFSYFFIKWTDLKPKFGPGSRAITHKAVSNILSQLRGGVGYFLFGVRRSSYGDCRRFKLVLIFIRDFFDQLFM